MVAMIIVKGAACGLRTAAGLCIMPRSSLYGPGVCRWKHPQHIAVSSRRHLSSSKPSADQSKQQTWFQKFLSPKPMPERHTAAWYKEVLLICTVFAITGSSTMVIVRPAVSDVLGIKGSFRDGPWTFRLISLFVMTPIYATLLVAVGTVFGRHAYFRHFSVRIFSRFGIPPEALDTTFHETKKTFRTW